MSNSSESTEKEKKMITKSHLISSHCNIMVTTDEGSYHENASSLISKGDNDFRGFSCDAGIHGIHIYNDGSVYGSVCKAELLGNVFTEFKLTFSPVKCTIKRCICVSDVKIPKRFVGATQATDNLNS